MSRSTHTSITPLVSSKKSGPHLVTISNVAKLKDNLGEVKLYKGNIGVVITFSNEDITHQELYWLNGYNYSKLLKLLQMTGCGLDVLNSKEVVGKRLWIVIRHNINGGEIDAELIDFSAEDKVPNYPQLIEEYDIPATLTDNEFPEPNF